LQVWKRIPSFPSRFGALFDSTKGYSIRSSEALIPGSAVGYPNGTPADPDECDGLSRGAQAVKGRTSALGEGLAALPTDEASLVVGMHADVACAQLPSDRTIHIRTECLCENHDGSPLDRIACSVVEDVLWTHSFPLFNLHYG
jgi:hypothetical protein